MAKFKLADGSWGPGMWVFYCPGCECCHYVRTESNPKQPNAPVWTWNGDPDNPNVTPSLHIFQREDGKDVTSCHLFVTNGHLVYLGDCPHKLAGQTVPIPDWDSEI